MQRRRAEGRPHMDAPMKLPYVVALALHIWAARQMSWEARKTGRLPNEVAMGTLHRGRTSQHFGPGRGGAKGRAGRDGLRRHLPQKVAEAENQNGDADELDDV